MTETTDTEGTTTMNTETTPDQAKQQRHADDLRLVAIAQARRPRVWGWWDMDRLLCGTRKYAECHICDEWIDTWAARWVLPKRVERAIEEHRALHVAELAEGR